MARVGSQMERLSSPLSAMLWLGAVAILLLSVAIAGEHPGATFAGRSSDAAAAWLIAGLALIAAGLYLWLGADRRREAALFGLAAVAWYLTEWNNPGVGIGPVFTVGLVARSIAPAVVAHAILAYPLGHLNSRLERLIIAVAYIDTALVLGLLPALFFDPAAHQCVLCPPNVLLVEAKPDLVDGLNWLGTSLLLGWTAGVVALAIKRSVQSSRAMRRVTAPVLVAGSVYMLLVLGAVARNAAPGPMAGAPTAYWLTLGQAVALLAIGLGVGWSWIIRRRTRSRIASLVVDLGTSPLSGGLQQMLAATLHDSELRLGYPIVDRDRPMDAAGRVVDAPDGSVETPLARQGRTVAVLFHRPGLLDDAGVVEEVVAAARLALDNERLQAEARARIEDLHASRARIVATTDAERRRLERDLHDGAQQRLVELSLALGLTRARVGEDATLSGLINDAEERVWRAIDGLRDVAHGIYPAVLSSDGLAAAIEALGERVPIPISLVNIPRDRFPTAVESAAYFFVAEVAGPFAMRTGATRALVDSRRDGDGLTLSVILEGVANRMDSELKSRLVDLEDRIGALDGLVTVEHARRDEFRIRAEIPCAW